ncbi:MAG: flagellar hook-associated protein FlgK [Bdellovibrionaceae bacterium]|nr:flagellar hook-associated protein FlgK [Pseudobdellovibrionaceae bacterium]
MSKINSMLDVGKRSMMNSQTALQTVGHNIANKSTEGYSRQRVEVVTNEPVTSGRLRIGMGSKSALVTRINNEYLEKQIGKEQANLGYLGGKSDAMMRVEQVYNEQSSKGLNKYIAEFFNAFRELGNNPESLATRTLVRETADFVTKDFGRVHSQLTEIRKDIDQQVITHVEEVNAYSEEIARLNEKIQLIEMKGEGAPANDERDRRDLLIKKLGEKVNIRWAEGEDGMVTISAGMSALLVTGYDAKKLVVQETSATERKGEGNVDIFYLPSERAVPVKVTEQFTGGSVGGLLEVRDQVITDLMSNMDNMAFTLATSVNEAHMLGFDGYNSKGGQFFRQPMDVRGSASNMRLVDSILEDPNRIAAAAQPNAPGDNRIANIVSQLQGVKMMNDGQSTFDDFYNGVVGQVGVVTRRTNTAHDSQGDIVKQLNHIRESISGVSLDEETTKMIEFQKSFDASARLIRTADEMFDTVLNLKRY